MKPNEIRIESTKWKREYLESVDIMYNDELFNEYTNLLTDVDNDSVRSSRNEWKLSIVTVKLKGKLIECGFF